MNNVNNHLASDPGVRIVVVALSTGVRAFTFGAQDAGGRPYAEWVDQLTAKGVEFRICQNSMNALKVTKKDLIDKVQVVPSGVAEIARLQAREGYVYIRP
jgi:intracellular sulfur oxidation DsrE/DsrF family protein